MLLVGSLFAPAAARADCYRSHLSLEGDAAIRALFDLDIDRLNTAGGAIPDAPPPFSFPPCSGPSCSQAPATPDLPTQHVEIQVERWCCGTSSPVATGPDRFGRPEEAAPLRPRRFVSLLERPPRPPVSHSSSRSS